MKNRLQTYLSLQKLPFWGVSVLCLIMAVATFVEKEHGSDYAYEQIYGAWWFSALWAILAIFSIVGIVKGQLYKNLSLLFVHISFILILAGALCTKLFAEQGHVILHQNEISDQMRTDDAMVSLPFKMELDTFYIAYYAGTNAPADYISHFTIQDQGSDEKIRAEVSMNNIFSHN